MAVSNLVYDLLKLLLWGAPKLRSSALTMLSAAHVLRGGMGMGDGGPGQLDGGLGRAGRRTRRVAQAQREPDTADTPLLAGFGTRGFAPQ